MKEQNRKQIKATTKSKQKSSTKKQPRKATRDIMPSTVTVTLLPNQSVDVVANFDDISKVCGMLDQARDNMMQINKIKFRNVNRARERARKIAQRRAASNWSKSEKARLHKAAHKSHR